MSTIRIWPTLLLLTFCLNSYSQKTGGTYHIKKSKGFLSDRCKSYKTVIKSFPEDIRYGVELIERDIYVIFPSKNHLMQLIDKRTDGIVIDVVHKDQYSCNTNVKLAAKWPNRGYLLRPVFKKEIFSTMHLDLLNNVVIPVGILPESLNPKEVEFNIMILQKKALCDYHVISDIELSSWDLLETGLYWDSIPITEKRDMLFGQSKSMDFFISFDKDKIGVKQEDIKKIHEKLELADYEISEIYINAYTSVEGTSERNEALQRGRAQSIIDSFQDYQSKEIATHISATEYWSQFAKDITGTRYEYLKRFSKNEIKNILSGNQELLDSLEPILKNQRIGHIRIVLERKLHVSVDDPQFLLKSYKENVSTSNLQNALYFQELIFANIRAGKSPDELVNQLEVPRESKYGPLFNNIILFNLERYNNNLSQAIGEFEYLLTLLPDSYKIKYNLTALKIKAWSAESTEELDRNVIKKLIDDLDKTNIPPALMKRLKINYYMILVQYLDYEKKFKSKERYIRSIFHNYKDLNLSQMELFSLAKYLSFNSKFDLAMDILSPTVLAGDASEEILFYYLKLAIVYPSKSKLSLETICQKAIEKNRNRFCQIYLPKSLGGFTFQVREDSSMNKLYCEYCENGSFFYSENRSHLNSPN